jgi:hypothetical protein
VPISAVDAISPAFQHTKKQLLEPFHLSQWAKVALVGMLAGELTSGSCNAPSFQMPHQTGAGRLAGWAWPTGDPSSLIALITLLAVFGGVLLVALIYVNSVMRFILFDTIVEKQCRIIAGWQRRTGEGMRYFVWQILFGLAAMAVMTILVGIPVGIAFVLGWLTHPDQHILPLVLGGIVLFLLFVVFVIGLMIASVFTKDFVVPQMALENISAVEAWRRLLRMLEGEKGGYLVYIIMKAVMALGAAVVVGIAAFIATLILLIPLGGFGAIAVLAGKAAGLDWNLYTISVAVVFGCIALAIILYVVSLISVPAIVFFPAYALYFFAPRYPALGSVMYPAPPSSQPPPLPPVPEPIG